MGPAGDYCRRLIAAARNPMHTATSVSDTITRAAARPFDLRPRFYFSPMPREAQPHGARSGGVEMEIILSAAWLTPEPRLVRIGDVEVFAVE